MSENSIIKFTDNSQSHFINNIAIYKFSVISSLYKSSSESYKTILSVTHNIKEILTNIQSVANTTITFNTLAEYDYEPIKKFNGYRTYANISYKIKLINQDNLIASKLMDDIFSFNNINSSVTLDQIYYTLSEKRKKKYELLMIKRAIINAKNKANLIVESTFGNISYKIIKMEVSTNKAQNNNYQSLSMKPMMAMENSTIGTQDVISQGKTKISAQVSVILEIY